MPHEPAVLRIRAGAEILMRGGVGVALVIGVGSTVAGVFAPGLAHAVAAAVAMLGVIVHMLLAGTFLTRPALRAMRNLRRRIVVRWCVRMANLLVLSWAYPLVVVPGVGAILPAAACAGMLYAQRTYLERQVLRDARGDALHPLETVLLLTMATVVLALIAAAITVAVVVGVTAQWLFDALGLG
jgi:hypothetical protein